MEDEQFEQIFELKRTLNSLEHMIYVSCKFTRTTEMIYTVIKHLVEAYDIFFIKGYDYILGSEDTEKVPFFTKIQLLAKNFEERGITVDLSDYKLLKQILLSEYESIGQYRKNLSLIAYLDDGEIVITLQKLIEFYKNLKLVYETLNPEKIY